MATPNIVPRADSEGGLGTASKYWASAYIDTITTTSHVKIASDAGKLFIGAANDLELSHNGTNSIIYNANEGSIIIENNAGDQDIIFKGKYGSSLITALTLDMSDAGAATFVSTVAGTSFNGIPFFSDGTSMYTHDVSGNTSYANADNNTAYGFTALDAITTGDSNVAIGHRAGTDLSGGSQNVVIGKDAGFDLTQANYSVAIGFEALYSETVGHYSVAIGRRALKNQNVADSYNTAVGYHAGTAITTGVENTLIGGQAGDAITTGQENLAIGFQALSTNIDGDKNVALGNYALQDFEADTDGHGSNTAVGYTAMMECTTGTLNTAVGALSLGNGVLTGDANVALGYKSGYALSGGSANTAVGYEALMTENGHGNNVAIGYRALRVQDAGSDAHNTAVGFDAGTTITTGTHNTLIGSLAGDGLILDKNNVVVGYQSLSAANAGSRNTAIGKGTLTVQQAVTQVTGGAYAASGDATITHDSSSRPEVGQLVTSSAAGIPSGATVLSVTDDTHFELSANTTSAQTGATITLAGNVESYNTAVGFHAGNDVTTGVNNTIVGGLAGDAITAGSHNTLMGYNAGGALDVGGSNIVIGAFAGDALAGGSSNVAIGYRALTTEDGHGRNVAIGQDALFTQNAGDNALNVAVGFEAGKLVSTGVKNTLIGGLAGDGITTGQDNVALGYGALSATDAGSFNTAVGSNSLQVQNASGGSSDPGTNFFNTAVGYNSGIGVTTGVKNTLIGGKAGDALTTGDNNIVIGFDAAASAVGIDNTTVIGTTTTVHALVHGLRKPVVTANADAAVTGTNTIYVFGDADGAIITLPNSSSGGSSSPIGGSYEFVISVTATSNNHKIVCANTSAEKIIGTVNMVATDNSDAQTSFAAAAGDNFSALTFNGSTTGTAGTHVKITCLAANLWVVEGTVHGTGTVATPLATS